MVGKLNMAIKDEQNILKYQIEYSDPDFDVEKIYEIIK